MTAPYAAPERWRAERATSAADVYALGVIAHELLSGSWPFNGPQLHDFREQHLHEDPPSLDAAPAALASIIVECLYKSAGARPRAVNLLARLESAQLTPASAGRMRLRQVNRQNVARIGQESLRASAAQSEAEKRQSLERDARASFQQISAALRSAVLAEAPTAIVQPVRDGAWSASMNGASLSVSGFTSVSPRPWQNWQAPSFVVIAAASVTIKLPTNHHHYNGRGHSLWFGDIKDEAHFGWYEAAFMITPLVPKVSQLTPFSLLPGRESAKALWNGVAEFQLAWPFTQLLVERLEEFIDRWLGWFADAAQGCLHHPTTMPERRPEGSWRR